MLDLLELLLDRIEVLVPRRIAPLLIWLGIKGFVGKLNSLLGRGACSHSSRGVETSYWIRGLSLELSRAGLLLQDVGHFHSLLSDADQALFELLYPVLVLVEVLLEVRWYFDEVLAVGLARTRVVVDRVEASSRRDACLWQLLVAPILSTLPQDVVRRPSPNIIPSH